MSQPTTFGSFTSGPKTPGQVAAQQNETFDAFLTGHLGTSRPAYAEDGTVWFKDTGVSPKVIEQYYYDGADDILMGTFDYASNVFTPEVPNNAVLNAAQTFTKTQTWTKGADVASASALTLGDGNYFDVTGTTTITSIATKGIGTTVKLHFDGAVLLTHHATDLVLPGGANYTTAAGDEFEFIEYASGDWRCTGYALASGESIVAGGAGGWEFVSTSTASASAAVAFTGFETGYDYLIEATGVLPATDNIPLLAELGISGPTYRTSGYHGLCAGIISTGTSLATGGVLSSSIRIAPNTWGNAADENGGFSLEIRDPAAATDTYFTGTMYMKNDQGLGVVGQVGGHHETAEAMDAIQFYFSSGNISTGTFKLYRRANA